MDVIIKIINKFDDEVLDFLIDESYILFCKVKGFNNFTDEQNKLLKKEMRNLYIASNHNKEKIYVAYKSGLVIGCAYVNETGYLSDLYVKKEERNQGVGSLILKKVISDYDGGLTLNAHLAVIEFYRKFGFEIIEEDGLKIKMKR